MFPQILLKIHLQHNIMPVVCSMWFWLNINRDNKIESRRRRKGSLGMKMTCQWSRNKITILHQDHHLNCSLNLNYKEKKGREIRYICPDDDTVHRTLYPCSPVHPCISSIFIFCLDWQLNHITLQDKREYMPTTRRLKRKLYEWALFDYREMACSLHLFGWLDFRTKALAAQGLERQCMYMYLEEEDERESRGRWWHGRNDRTWEKTTDTISWEVWVKKRPTPCSTD